MQNIGEAQILCFKRHFLSGLCQMASTLMAHLLTWNENENKRIGSNV